MAKRAKTESVRAREARVTAEVAATAAGEHAAQEAKQEAERAAEAAREDAERKRAAKAAPKPKRPRFVRAGKASAPDVADAPLPSPSTKPAGKLYSKNAKPAPKEAAAGPNRGPAVPRDKRQVRHEGVSRK